MTRDEYLEIKSEQSKHISLQQEGYRIVITPNFEVSSDMTDEERQIIEQKNLPIEFDYVSNVSVSASSNITSYPTVKGDTIADHMIRNQNVITINGVFSLYGNRPTTFKGEYDRLTNIETLFEEIKNTGTMCDIMTLKRGSDNNQRFKARKNMVLTNIKWTEKQSSVEFDFTFTEAMTVETKSLMIDYTDENLPSITDASTLDFTDTLLDFNEVDKLVIQILKDKNLVTDDFLSQLTFWATTISKNAFTSAIGGAFTGTVLTGITSVVALSVVYGGLTAIGPVGWAVIAVTAAVGAIAGAIAAYVNSIKKDQAEREFGIKAFEDYKDDRKNQEENIRFCNYVGSIHQKLETLEEHLKVYGISSNEEQECMTYIDDNYYIFTFKKSNTTSSTTWMCNIESADSSLKKDIGNLNSTALQSINECTSSNYIFRTIGDGHYVYFINKSLFSVTNSEYSSSEERTKAIQECKEDLSNYSIFVSEIDMSEFNTLLKDTILNALKAS